jgi:hypothetical protein
LDSSHCTWSWKRRPKQEFTDWITTINGNPNLNVLNLHARMTQDMEKEPVLRMGTDGTDIRVVKLVQLDSLRDVKWKMKDGLQTDRNRGLIWYTGTGAGVYGNSTRWKLNFSLGQYTILYKQKHPYSLRWLSCN